MSSPPITELLRSLESGTGDAADQLAEAVHERLQRIAEREFAVRYGARRGALTIEPGVLANDALLKILDGAGDFDSRQRLFAYATRVIVNALTDYQRRRLAKKRGGDQLRVTFSKAEGQAAVDFEKLPPALEQLENFDRRKADVVRLRVFWGMSVPEAARFLEVSPSTVDREWRFAQRWLAQRLREDGAEGAAKENAADV